MTDEEGKKRITLVGMWNSYLDMQKCDEEGTPLPGSELVRLWTVSQSHAPKPNVNKKGIIEFTFSIPGHVLHYHLLALHIHGIKSVLGYSQGEVACQQIERCIVFPVNTESIFFMH